MANPCGEWGLDSERDSRAPSPPSASTRPIFDSIPFGGLDMDDLKALSQSNASGGFLQDTPPRADVDEILRRKRKAREYKVRCRSPWTDGWHDMA